MSLLHPSQDELQRLCQQLTPGLHQRFPETRKQDWRFEYLKSDIGRGKIFAIVAPCPECGKDAVCYAPQGFFGYPSLRCECGWERYVGASILSDCEAIRANFPALYAE